MTNPIMANNFYVGQKFRDITKQTGINTPIDPRIVPVIILNTTDAPAEVRQSFPQPALNQTIINSFLVGNGSNQTAYTVPIGKKFFLMGVSGVGASGNGVEVFQTDGSTYITRIQCGSNLSCQEICAYPMAQYLEGESVICKATNTMNYHVWGYIV